MKRYILIFSIVLLAMQAFAQHDEQVTVEGSYRPQIKRSERLMKMPETPENEFNIPNYKADDAMPRRPKAREYRV